MISICIPAYKRAKYLERLLKSIANQTFRDFEVIISDDSPDTSIQELTGSYKTGMNIFYYHNTPSLGTPANWNFAISKAKGEWIKLMHDDDWFASKESLQVFADHTKKGSKLIFSAYTNYQDGPDKRETPVFPPSVWRKRIANEPLALFARNVIGPPSVTIIHKSINSQYDERMKWRVDIDLYAHILRCEKSFTYIDIPLINVGVNEGQVTNECFENPLVELPEGFLLIEKYGTKPLNNIYVYDAWWRLLRNMSINSPEKLTNYVDKPWPETIITITKRLGRISSQVLRIGVLSKILMFLSFVFKSGRDKS